jgi:hypothetical protein
MKGKAILILGLAAMQFAATTSSGLAADLEVRRSVRAHKHWRVVRDYDGTPIVLRARRDEPGIYDAIWVQRATPPRYLNGQPVMPTVKPLNVWLPG